MTTHTMLKRIEAGEKRIADVFSDRYAFTIPPYQRPYAWEVQQASELVDDLLDAMDPSSRSEGLYFLGSIVLVKTPDSPDAKVVDGQQRLTTLTILFSVLRDLTNDLELKISRETYVKQAANPDRNLHKRLRLLLRQRDQAFFENTVQRRDATASLPRLEGLEGSQARIVENALLYRKRLLKMTDAERSRLISFILNNCYLVVVEVPTDTAARRIFTVLNARGLDLTATDILKADLLERAGQARENELSTHWEEIELSLDRDRFSDLFTHIRMIFQREKPRSALEVGFPESVHPFRDDPGNFISGTLEPFAEAFTLAEDRDRIERLFDARTASLLRSLNRLDNKDWVPPLLLRLKQFSANENVDVPDFIVKLERLAYYLFVIRSDVNARISRYADVLEQIAPREERTRRSTGLELNNQEIHYFLEALDGPVYLKSRVVKPLLLRLDSALSDGSAIYDYPVISVEHVCPQTIESSSQWDEWFSDHDAHTQWLHRAANLVLLTHRKNSSAGNWDLDRKKSTYFTKNNGCPFFLTRQVLDAEEWTPKTLEHRQIEVLRTLSRSWEFEDEFDNWLQSTRSREQQQTNMQNPIQN